MQVVVSADGDEVTRAVGTVGSPVRLVLPDPRPWTPEDPFLYDLDVRVVTTSCAVTPACVRSGSDPMPTGIHACCQQRRAVSAFGRPGSGLLERRIGDRTGRRGAGARHRHDEGPGFTMLRKHIKIEPLRWYYHRRLGMLVWQDLERGAPIRTPWCRCRPCCPGGCGIRGTGRSGATTKPPSRVAHRDARHAHSSAQRGESGGLGSVQRGLGPVRCSSGGRGDRRSRSDLFGGSCQRMARPGAGDLTSLRTYFRPFRVPRRRRATQHRVLALTEYGGYRTGCPITASAPASSATAVTTRRTSWQRRSRSCMNDNSSGRPARVGSHGLHPTVGCRGRDQRAAHL